MTHFLMKTPDNYGRRGSGGRGRRQTKKFTLVHMKRFLMKNPGNEAWIKGQEKVHEATLVSQARSKLLRNSMYPELSVVHAQIATHSPMMADLSEQCWWKGVFTRVLKELLQLERFTATMMGKQKITTYKTRTWRSKSYGLYTYEGIL